MKFVSDIRLLLLGLWLGASVFFIVAAQVAFAVLPERELAGAVVGRNLSILNFAGLGIAVILLVTSIVGSAIVNKIWLWVERFLLVVLGAACAVGQFVIGYWLSAVRAQMGRPIDELAADDPLRAQFNTLHEYSTWIFLAAMVAALITFFIITNRTFNSVKAADTGVYDFSKEFKV